jgi:hypothetical protein
MDSRLRGNDDIQRVHSIALRPKAFGRRVVIPAKAGIHL